MLAKGVASHYVQPKLSCKARVVQVRCALLQALLVIKRPPSWGAADSGDWRALGAQSWVARHLVCADAAELVQACSLHAHAPAHPPPRCCCTAAAAAANCADSRWPQLPVRLSPQQQQQLTSSLMLRPEPGQQRRIW